MKFNIILINSDQPNSGKTSFSHYVKSKHKNIIFNSFAKYLKIETAKKYNININYFTDNKLKDIKLSNMNFTPRELLILEASENRKNDNLFYVKKMYNDIKYDLKNNNMLFIDDYRFPIEMDIINFIKLHRDDVNLTTIKIIRTDLKQNISDNNKIINTDIKIKIGESNNPGKELYDKLSYLFIDID